VYFAPIGSKHESESLFQNLAAYIAEVQTLGGIVLLGGDFNARTATLPDTINTSDLCELLQAPKLVETKQPSIVVKQQNRDANIGGWARELLDLCRDAGLFIFNGRTLGDESREFTYLANGGHITIDYIVGSPVVWQATTHLEVIIDDTHYCVIGGDSDHRPLRLLLNIDCSSIQP
jgi:exonuclease III